jgi:nicotinamidase-related amidase
MEAYMSEPLSLDPATTALILVDLQNFTVDMATVPLSGRQVLDNSTRLAKACRDAGIAVVLVRVGHEDHSVPSLRPVTDAPFSGFQFPPGAKEIAADLGPEPQDIIIDKYNWGAFYGTNMDVHLRRRGIKTLIVGGLVINIGVDTTMRHAHERGYDQILVTDATAAMSIEEYDYTLRFVAPRLSRVRTSGEIIDELRVYGGTDRSASAMPGIAE